MNTYQEYAEKTTQTLKETSLYTSGSRGKIHYPSCGIRSRRAGAIRGTKGKSAQEIVDMFGDRLCKTCCSSIVKAAEFYSAQAEEELVEVEGGQEVKAEKVTSSFKIDYNPTTQKFFTDISDRQIAEWIIQTFTKARKQVKEGEFYDLAGAMACTNFDLPYHFQYGVSENIAGLATLDPYAMALATLEGGNLEDVQGGGYVSWFWNDGPGAEIQRCRSAKGLLEKVYTYRQNH